MNKYIRTKNNVYEVEEEKEYFYITTTGQLPYKKDVISQADTIEELCDEYVGIYQNICEVVVDYRKWYKYDTFYGAIWTDKGLIYVAKMKEKGDLELL